MLSVLYSASQTCWQQEIVGVKEQFTKKKSDICMQEVYVLHVIVWIGSNVINYEGTVKLS